MPVDRDIFHSHGFHGHRRIKGKEALDELAIAMGMPPQSIRHEPDRGMAGEFSVSSARIGRGRVAVLHSDGPSAVRWCCDGSSGSVAFAVRGAAELRWEDRETFEVTARRGLLLRPTATSTLVTSASSDIMMLHGPAGIGPERIVARPSCLDGWTGPAASLRRVMLLMVSELSDPKSAFHDPAVADRVLDYAGRALHSCLAATRASRRDEPQRRDYVRAALIARQAANPSR